MMPGLVGVKTLKAIRDIENQKGIEEYVDDRIKGIKSGADDYILGWIGKAVFRGRDGVSHQEGSK